MKQLIGHKEMASNCTGRGLDWILGKIFSGKRLPNIGTGCQRNWMHCYTWRYLTCCFGTGFTCGPGSVRLVVDLHDLRSLSNLHDSMALF